MFFKRNDTLVTSFPLRQYYAYDDGRADYSVRLTNPGNRLAYRFVMPVDTATLYGFYIYFPLAGTNTSETLDMYIYDDNNGQPGNVIYSLLSRTITKNGNNGYTKMLIEPLFLLDSVFYIGYKQSTSDGIRLGLDKSNDTGDQIFVYVNSWIQNTDIHGSLMIRPFFGKGSSLVTSVPNPQEDMVLYPNPNNGTFVIPGGFTELTVMDVTGRPIGWRSEDVNNDKKIILNTTSTGIYFVRWASKKKLYTRKLVVN